MTDDRPEAPREGEAEEATAPEASTPEPSALDDTAAPSGDGGPDAGQAGIPDDHAAFMRPGSTPEQTQPPRAASPVAHDELDGPAPRRSASSSVTPPRPGFLPPASGAAGASMAGAVPPPARETQTTGQTDAAGTTGATGADDREHEEPVDELSTRKRKGNPWPMRLLATLLALGLAAGAFYLMQQSNRKENQVVKVTQTPSSSPTPKPKPVIDNASLLTTSEAGSNLGGQGWKDEQTLSEVGPNDLSVTCMTITQGLPNSLATRQRVLSSQTQAGTAALQRLDSYTSEDQAKQAYKVRLARLSACDDIPALLHGAHEVNNLADEAFSVTVALQKGDVEYHTVMLSRTGTTVQMLDVSNNGEPIDAADALKATATSAERYCDAAKGTCPADPTARAQVVPATPLYGWLAQSDFPRISKDRGIWSATKPATVAIKGSQCENLTLADATGPTEREQRSYLLDQDEAAPEGFGVDQVRFTFKDEKAAEEFATTLGDNIAGCPKRLETAKLSGDKKLTITGEDRAPVKGRVFLVTQSTSKTTDVQYRVGIAQSGNRVTYLVSNTSKTFDFTDDSWVALTARAGQRITQAK